ncbi:MAG: glycosyltransferase family 2 protein [Dysgonamonadaceae bacterium]|jgi:glycosyltransferase involved in cell wall biosynthesis|nr:glycosyltransferase family 2 protein [Dysgonamonadaceae bacterium]
MNISIVIPLYNESESLPELYEWIISVVNANDLSYEIIFVDDGSRDNSWSVISDIAKNDKNVKGIRFGRNYGKSPALQYGFAKAEGDVVITMDADLQDSPAEIPELYRIISEKGYHLVSGWKRKRRDPLSKTIPTKLFNATARAVTGIKLHDFNCGLKAYKKEVIKNIELYNDMHRWIPYLAKNAGYTKICEKVVHHRARKYGSSKFGIDRFFNGYLDLFTLGFLSKFGKKPMHIFGLIGSLMFIIGFIAILVVGTIKFISLQKGTPAPLLASTPWFHIALTSMVIGTQLFLAGFIGELITRNSPDRNKYIVADEIDESKKAQEVKPVEKPKPFMPTVNRFRQPIKREDTRNS